MTKVLHFIKSFPEDNCLTPVGDPNHIHFALLDPKNKKYRYGKFDIQDVLKELPAGWQPNVITVSSSLGLYPDPPVPTGMKKLNIPVVVKLTDSHHHYYPFEMIVNYCKQIDGNFHWTSYDRHHLGLFALSGLRNLFWLPPTYVVTEQMLAKLNFGGPKKYKTIFRGTVGKTHPIRQTLFDKLKEQGIEVDLTRKSHQDTLQDFVDAQIVLNVSLNSDLNRRLFETLLVGGFLITDRLSAESGMRDMFEEGVHYEAFGDEDELVRKINYYLENPEEAARIGQQGRAKFLADYSFVGLEKKFYQHFLTLKPIHSVFHQQFKLPLSDIYTVEQRYFIYEFFQEVQRVNSYISYCVDGLDKAVKSDLSSLSRMRLIDGSANFFVRHTSDKAPDGVKEKFSRHGVTVYYCGDSNIQMPEFPAKQLVKNAVKRIVRRWIQ